MESEIPTSGVLEHGAEARPSQGDPGGRCQSTEDLRRNTHGKAARKTPGGAARGKEPSVQLGSERMEYSQAAVLAGNLPCRVGSQGAWGLTLGPSESEEGAASLLTGMRMPA